MVKETSMGEDRLMVSVSGIRGTIGGTLSPEIACDFGLAFAKLLGAGKKVVIGADTRPSGPMIRSAVAKGLLQSGIDVIDLGVVTTPGVALMVRKLAADGGVVITASHNPGRYNGIKFLQREGWGLTAAIAAELKRIWEAREFALVPAEHQGRLSSDTTTFEQHVAGVCDDCDVDAISAKRFKVVLDSINGAGCEPTAMLLERLNCELVHLNGDPTGVFAHEPEPIEKNLRSLCEAVIEHKADVGFAQDPDADRLVMVDEKGAFPGEEYTLALTGAFVLRKRKGKLATNMVTSRMIDDIAAKVGVEVIRAPTGEANVVEAMMREGCIFGGEGNGGVIDPRVVPIRNSLIGIAMILQYLAETGKSLSELAAEIPKYVMIKTKMKASPETAPQVARRARDTFESRPGVKFNDLDGLRVDLPEGWVSVRPSNTEPIMRITAEAPDAPTAQSLVNEVQEIADEVIAKN
jgi:phosphomannomutase